MESKSFFEFIHPEDLERVQTCLGGIFENKGFTDITHRIVTPSGEVKHVFERGETKHNEEVYPELVFGTVQDITEYHEREQKMAI